MYNNSWVLRGRTAWKNTEVLRATERCTEVFRATERCTEVYRTL